MNEFIEAGSRVVCTLTKTRKVVCSETILCNTNDLYMTIEPRVTLNDPVHHYVCRYVRKNKRTPYLKSLKTFVVYISFNGGLIYGINTNDGICDFEIISKFVDLLKDMYHHEMGNTNFEGGNLS